VNEQRRWVAERAVVLTFICPRCGRHKDQVSLKQIDVAQHERAKVLGLTEQEFLIHCRGCSL